MKQRVYLVRAAVLLGSVVWTLGAASQPSVLARQSDGTLTFSLEKALTEITLDGKKRYWVTMVLGEQDPELMKDFNAHYLVVYAGEDKKQGERLSVFYCLLGDRYFDVRMMQGGCLYIYFDSLPSDTMTIPLPRKPAASKITSFGAQDNYNDVVVYAEENCAALLKKSLYAGMSINPAEPAHKQVAARALIRKVQTEFGQRHVTFAPDSTSVLSSPVTTSLSEASAEQQVAAADTAADGSTSPLWLIGASSAVSVASLVAVIVEAIGLAQVSRNIKRTQNSVERAALMVKRRTLIKKLVGFGALGIAGLTLAARESYSYCAKRS